MHCCIAKAPRTLHHGWDRILPKSGDECRVNLLLKGVAEWLDVHSYLSVQRKVVLKIKKAGKVAARLPEWVAFE